MSAVPFLKVNRRDGTVWLASRLQDEVGPGDSFLRQLGRKQWGEQDEDALYRVAAEYLLTPTDIGRRAWAETVLLVEADWALQALGNWAEAPRA